MTRAIDGDSVCEMTVQSYVLGWPTTTEIDFGLIPNFKIALLLDWL